MFVIYFTIIKLSKKTKQKETKRKRERMTDIEKWGQRDILSSF